MSAKGRERVLEIQTLWSKTIWSETLWLGDQLKSLAKELFHRGAVNKAVTQKQESSNRLSMGCNMKLCNCIDYF